MARNTELFIKTVQKYPVMYDTSHPEYRNRSFRNTIWEDIAEIVGESDGETLKKQWKNLRDAYSKHLKFRKGQTANYTDRYRSWPWAKLMSFLRPHLELAEIHLNRKRTAKEDSASQSSTQGNEEVGSSHTRQGLHTRHVHRQRKHTLDQSQCDATDADEVINFISNKEDDDIDLLFKSYAKKLKKMTNRRQATVKFEIAQIMLKAELEEYDEVQSNSDAEQYRDNNMVLIVEPSPSGADSDISDTDYK